MLQKVAQRQRWSGRAVKDERSNAFLWRYIAGLDPAVAWQLAAALAARAVACGRQVLVFQHLKFEAVPAGTRHLLQSADEPQARTGYGAEC